MSLPIGTVTVSTAATPVAMAEAAMAVRALSLKARPDNSGPVYVGNAGVAATNGYCLSPGDEVTLQFGNAIDLRRLYVTAANAGDRVDFAGVAASGRVQAIGPSRQDMPGTIPL